MADKRARDEFVSILSLTLTGTRLSPASPFIPLPPITRSQGNPINDARHPSIVEENPGTPARKGKMAKTWATSMEKAAKTLVTHILKNGGLTTVDLPHNEDGSVDMREAINQMLAEYLIREDKANPRFMSETNRREACQPSSSFDKYTHKVSKALYFQSEKTRSGASNPLHEDAPGWTTLYFTGEFLVAKPIDVCHGLMYAIANIPEYSGLEIHLIDGEADTIISIDELEKTEIVMLPPPSRTGRNNRECPRLTPQVTQELNALREEVARLRSLGQQ